MYATILQLYSNFAEKQYVNGRIKLYGHTSKRPIFFDNSHINIYSNARKLNLTHLKQVLHYTTIIDCNCDSVLKNNFIKSIIWRKRHRILPISHKLTTSQDYIYLYQLYNNPVFQGGANSRAEQFRVEGVSFGERMSSVFVQQPRNTKHKHIQTEKTVIAGQAVAVFFVYLSERRNHMNVITK